MIYVYKAVRRTKHCNCRPQALRGYAADVLREMCSLHTTFKIEKISSTAVVYSKDIAVCFEGMAAPYLAQQHSSCEIMSAACHLLL